MPKIYNLLDAEFRPKMAAFDFDWTLVCPKDGKTFPTGVDDWTWLFPTVVDKIKSYYNDRYMIVIFTNQSKEWKQEQIQLVGKQIGIPLFIVVAFSKEEYKPSLAMYNSFIDSFIIKNDSILNKTESFFVGDALGRPTDFADSDRKFAENIGIPYYSPEAIFHEKTPFSIHQIQPSTHKEIVIMVGYPGSGKTTISRELCKNENYIHIEGDVYKTQPKMLKVSLEFIKENKSIVFDATHSSKKKREVYVEFAKKHGYNVRCIHVSTGFDESYKRNRLRDEDKQIPKIAFSVYKKHFEPPCKEEEGFELIEI
jgi:bifunctional polynucleotide phosphatase/kinase